MVLVEEVATRYVCRHKKKTNEHGEISINIFQ